MMNWMVSSKDPDYEEKNRVSSYRGYLLKMRRSNNLLAPQWGKRWFSLEGRFLRWYRLDTDAIPSGQIDLRHVRSISKVDINGAYTFCVSSEDRNLIVRANSIAEMNGWIRSLHMQADIARGGSGMTVVSDFNDLPFSNAIFHPRRSSKSKSSLTLEQQLDLNLRKLNELELELSHPSDELSPEPARCEQNYIYEEKEEDEESPGTLHYFSPNNTRNKTGKKRQGGHYINNRNPLAEAPSAQLARLSQPPRNIPQPTSANTTGGVLRCISSESFENLDYSIHDRNVNNDNLYTASNGSTDECAAVASVPIQSSPHNSSSHCIRTRVRTTDSSNIATTLTGGGDTAYPSGDELERSVDSEYDLPTVDTIRRVQPHVGAKFMPTSTSIYVNPMKHNNNKVMDSQLIHSNSNKVRSVSSESADSNVGCLYIPDISEASSNSPHHPSRNNNSNSSIIINNRITKSAWD